MRNSNIARVEGCRLLRIFGKINIMPYFTARKLGFSLLSDTNDEPKSMCRHQVVQKSGAE
jgi:hypothetical protein